MSKTVSAYRGSLDLYYQMYDSSGNKLPAVYPGGNMTEFSITPDAEETEVISTGNSDYGQAADSMTDQKPTKVSWSTNRFNSMLWAVAFMGQMIARTGSETTVTDEAVTVSKGEMFRVDALDISAVTITDDSGTTTYVEGTDFTVVDAALGLFKHIEDGGIADGDEVLIDYTKGAESGYTIKGGIDSSKFIYVFGRGVNRFNNKRSIVEIGKISVTPSGSFSFVSTDPASMTMEGTVIAPGDGTEGYRIHVDE